MNAPGGIVVLYLAQRGRCFHCSEPMLVSAAAKGARGWDKGWTREHVIPLSKGGRNGHSSRNVVLAHRKCNSLRGNQDASVGMLERAVAVWDAADWLTIKEARRIVSDRTLRERHCA